MPVQGMLWTSHWLDVDDGADLSATVTMDGFGPSNISGRLDVSRFGPTIQRRPGCAIPARQDRDREPT
jgi:hypothetical protein